MEQDFYRGYLRNKYGVEVVIPDDDGRKTVHDIIYHELCQGVISTESKWAYLEVVQQARRMEAVDSVIFGCTEVGLLVGPDDFDIPIFDTTKLHAHSALDFALGQ